MLYRCPIAGNPTLMDDGNWLLLSFVCVDVCVI